MQWLPFKIYRWKTPIPAPLQIEDLGSFCNRWLHVLLGPEFSSDIMRDGWQSASAVSRREASMATTNPVLACETAPLCGTKSRPRRPSPTVPTTLSAEAFYVAHKGDNKWVSLREGGIITGTESDKEVVFAKIDISPTTKITPYVGRIRPVPIGQGLGG